MFILEGCISCQFSVVSLHERRTRLRKWVNCGRGGRGQSALDVNFNLNARSWFCGFFSVPVALLGCPILDEVKGGIPPLLSPWNRAHQQAVLAGVEEGESGFTAKPSNMKPYNIRRRVNCGASPGKGRAEQEGESGFTAKPSNISRSGSESWHTLHAWMRALLSSKAVLSQT